MTIIEPDDLDISVVRPGAVPRGSGGQTVGQNDPYVRITHRPTGITVERDEHRSQLMNKDSAMKELRSLLAAPHPDTAADRWAALRLEIQGLRAIHYDHANDLADEGKDAERVFGQVDAYDYILTRMDREDGT